MGRIFCRLLLSSIAAAMCVSLLSAQHVSRGAAAHSGFSGGFHGSSSAVHAASPHYASSGARFGNSGFGSTGFTGANRLPPPASGISPYAWSQIQRGNRFGYRHVPYGYFFAPYYYPFLGYDNSSFPGYSDQIPPDDDAGAEDMMSQGALGQQMQSLSDQISQLRDAQRRGPVPPASDSQQNDTAVPVTVVLRNGQQIQVQNYAVMGQTFWDFSHQPARKIPIATIDIAASARATESKGGEFPQITATP